MTRNVAMLAALMGALSGLHAARAEPQPRSQFAEKTIDIRKMTCKTLMAGSDRDRAVGITFFHGYLAGKNANPIVDVTALSALSDRVADYCLSNPTSTVMTALAKASEAKPQVSKLEKPAK